MPLTWHRLRARGAVNADRLVSRWSVWISSGHREVFARRCAGICLVVVGLGPRCMPGAFGTCSRSRRRRHLVSSAPELKVGDGAPDFSLPGSDGRVYSLKEYRGRQAIVLAWFAKAFTSA